MKTILRQETTCQYSFPKIHKDSLHPPSHELAKTDKQVETLISGLPHGVSKVSAWVLYVLQYLHVIVVGSNLNILLPIAG